MIAALSTVIEWYDFTLYLYFATVMARVFFDGSATSLATTLAGFAVAYLIRPLGALAFGRYGDRFGRRRMLLWSMALMTAAMLATALLPTRAQVGPAAGWAMLGLRCVMGFAVGGEYTGVVAYLLEGARAERRGLVTSCASAASEVGALAAVGVAAVTVGATGSALDDWGWRVPFLVGAALAGSIWLARSTMQESPEFDRQLASGTVPPSPVRHLLATARAGIARSFTISALGSITYYVGISYVPTFLVSTGAMREGAALWLSTIAAVVVIAVTPVTGIAADRFGRKPVLVMLAGLAAILPITLFWLMRQPSYPLALTGVVMLAALGGAVSGVGAVATAEQFAGEGRLTGLALGTTSATAIFGGFTPWLSNALMTGTGSPLVPGIMIAVVALAVLPVFLTMPETAPRHRRGAT